jgi:hypothetical protein
LQLLKRNEELHYFWNWDKQPVGVASSVLIETRIESRLPYLSSEVGETSSVTEQERKWGKKKEESRGNKSFMRVFAARRCGEVK